MRANLIFFRERFAYFNDVIFDRKLPPVKLRMSSSIRTLGTFRHPRGRHEAIKPENLIISLSNRLDLPQEIIEDTIIHEMIHLYIYWFDIKDSSAHGTTFRRIMSLINRKFGRKITISHKSTEEEKQTDRLHKPRIVIISELTQGETGVTVCSPRYTKTIYPAIKKMEMVKAVNIIASSDNIFAHYPASRTPKIYKISKENLEKAMQSAIFIEFKDNKLKPVNKKKDN